MNENKQTILFKVSVACFTGEAVAQCDNTWQCWLQKQSTIWIICLALFVLLVWNTRKGGNWLVMVFLISTYNSDLSELWWVRGTLSWIFLSFSTPFHYSWYLAQTTSPLKWNTCLYAKGSKTLHLWTELDSVILSWSGREQSETNPLWSLLGLTAGDKVCIYVRQTYILCCNPHCHLWPPWEAPANY